MFDKIKLGIPLSGTGGGIGRPACRQADAWELKDRW